MKVDWATTAKTEGKAEKRIDLQVGRGVLGPSSIEPKGGIQ